MPIDYESTRATVQGTALELRRRHNAMDWKAQIDDLIELEGLSQETLMPGGGGGILTKVWHAIESTAKKVKAVLAVKEQLILIAHDLPPTKTPFAKGHELGHSALGWHRDILYVCDEHDLTQKTRDQMEFEANMFSAEVLLPEPLLAAVYGQYPISMETVLLLKQWSGASIETCAIKYVQNHPGVCTLLTLDNETNDQGIAGLKLTRKSLSRTAVKSALGTLTTGQFFGPEHKLYRASRGVGVAQVHVTVGDTRFSASVFNNRYRVMALICDQV